MKKQVNAYNFKKISSRMAKEFGTIKKGYEELFTNVLLPMESNLIKTNRKYGIDNGRRADEAICICLLTIDGYINQIEYDLDPYLSKANEPFVTAMLYSFDPFSNDSIKKFAEETCDLTTKEGMRDYFELLVKCLLRIQDSIEMWTKELGINGYFVFLEEQIGGSVPYDDVLDCIIIKVDE
jgi:hypothetical protein